MKNIVFKLIHHNWSLMKLGSWNNTQWFIYEDNTYEKIEYYNSEIDMRNDYIEKSHTTYKLTDEEMARIMNRIRELIPRAKIEDKDIGGCDGTAWSFAYYENGKAIWERKTNYIYGITALEEIAGIFDYVLPY